MNDVPKYCQELRLSAKSNNKKRCEHSGAKLGITIENAQKVQHSMNPNILAVWKNVETLLNVRLRHNMMDLLLDMARDPATDSKKIAAWMLTTSTCICNAIFEKEDPFPLLYFYIRALDDHYPDLLKRVAQIYSNQEFSELIPVIADRDEFLGILWAAGSTFANGELIFKGDEIDITPKGLKQFRSIWKAPAQRFNHPSNNYMFSFNSDVGSS